MEGQLGNASLERMITAHVHVTIFGDDQHPVRPRVACQALQQLEA